MRGKLGCGWDDVDLLLDRLRTLLTVIPLDIPMHEQALQIARRYQIGIYDAMIVAAASQAGSDILYSEDMHHGLIVGVGLTIVNPFRA